MAELPLLDGFSVSPSESLVLSAEFSAIFLYTNALRSPPLVTPPFARQKALPITAHHQSRKALSCQGRRTVLAQHYRERTASSGSHRSSQSHQCEPEPVVYYYSYLNIMSNRFLPKYIERVIVGALIDSGCTYICTFSVMGSRLLNGISATEHGSIITILKVSGKAIQSPTGYARTVRISQGTSVLCPCDGKL